MAQQVTDPEVSLLRLSHSHGAGSIPGLGTSACLGREAKKNFFSSNMIYFVWFLFFPK